MTKPAQDLLIDSRRSNWVSLRTLVILRWFAVIGQSIAIFTTIWVLELQIPLSSCVLAVGASITANIYAIAVYPETKRMSEREAMFMLFFDISQLALLLFLTGGLHNPFAVLMLAPVTIAATFLHLRQTILLGVIAIALLSFVAKFHVPVQDSAGVTLQFPALFLFGFWLALVVGVIFLGIYAHRVISEMRNMSDALAATQLALAREQKLTDLGGVVAAAAHELGTPLATIKLVSSELSDELADHPELLEDARLIGEQANRCRDILRSMGQSGKDDLHLRRAPIEAVIKEAAAPHLDRGKSVLFELQNEGNGTRQPTILRRPEIIHGLRNMIQNAVDFSRSDVLVVAQWSDENISIMIEDDGPGFPTHVIGRIGDPFVGRRRNSARPGYDGMGLGLFIAKTLLERSGATLIFVNGRGQNSDIGLGGAMVVVTWPRSAIEVPEGEVDGPLGENQLLPV